ncbi:MAG: mevalonate kinase [Pseudomonadota bacterium]|nr:mevalonate kinase [Pseudomonadota bacterium]
MSHEQSSSGHGPWRGSAPGKLILSGEHAVVYGYRAVAAAVSLRTTVSLSPRSGPSALEHSAIRDDRVWPALATLLPADGLGVSIESDLPVGCGMGSSAALAIATIRALAAREGRVAGFTECFAKGFLPERVLHGNPSGVDHAVSALDKVVLYRREGPEIVALDVPSPLRLVVVDTGTPGDTAAMVAGVRERAPLADLRRIGAIAEMVSARLQRGEDPGPLLTENHVLLRRIGVSTPALDRACAVLLDAGATGAKLAGAGGGGVAIGVVTPETEAPVLDAAREAGFRAFGVVVGG